MKYLRKIIFLSLTLGLCLTAASCGRYSNPSPIPGSGYPHNYPQH